MTTPITNTPINPEPSLSPAPAHIAIIMDGNGRWAKSRGLPRAIGHREGVEALRRVVDACPDLGVKHLTVYSFSTENWKRPPAEIEALFDLLKRFVKRDLAKLHNEGVRIRIVGARDGLSPDIIDLIEHSMNLTQHNTQFHLNIAFNYGGRAEITEAMRVLARQVESGALKAEDITQDTVANAIWSAGSPDPDLVIRTSGEQRLSNFLLWTGAYAELVFPEVWWPDFDREQLEQAITTYRSRDRRFGGIGE